MLALCSFGVECRLFHWHSRVGRGTERITIKCVSSVHNNAHVQNSWSILDHFNSFDQTSYYQMNASACLMPKEDTEILYHSNGFVSQFSTCVSVTNRNRASCSILYFVFNDVWFVVQQEVIRLGGEVELADLGLQHGANINLPPVLLGILGKDPAKKTVSS